MQNKILVQGGWFAELKASKPARRLAKPLLASGEKRGFGLGTLKGQNFGSVRIYKKNKNLESGDKLGFKKNKSSEAEDQLGFKKNKSSESSRLVGI